MKNLPYRLFIFVLIFAPLAFGTVEYWSYAIMEGAVLLALFILLIQKNAKQTWVEVPGFWPLMLFLAYILVQLVPLPPGLMNVISPATYRLYGETVALFDPEAWMTLTVNKKETLSEFFRFSAYAALYIVTVQLLTDKVLLQRTLYIIAGFAAFFALFAIVQRFTSNHKILWLMAAPNSSFFGTYVNRNHYAGFMGMLFPVVVSLFLFMKPEAYYTTFRERIVEFFSEIQSHIYVLLWLSSLLMAVSIFLCRSRGGIVSMCLALSFLGLLLAFRGKNKKAGVTLCALFLSILFAVGWFGWDPIFERFNHIRNETGEIQDARLLIWQDSRPIIGDFPVTGSGFGTFNSIFPAYGRFPGGITFTHSHNDYIELATDGGLVAYLLVGCFLGAVFLPSIRVFRKRRDAFSIYLFAGCSAGLLSLLLHSFTDYNLRLGANGLYFFLLLGLMVSAAHTRLRGERQPTLLKKINIFPARWVSIPIAVIWGGAVVFNLGAHAGALYVSPLWHTLFQVNSAQSRVTGVLPYLDRAAFVGPLDSLSTQNEVADIHHRLDRAVLLDPLESLYPLLRAKTILLDAQNVDSAKPCYEAAIRLKPSDGAMLGELALFYSQRPEQLDIAEKVFHAAIKYHGLNPDGRKEYGLWLLGQDRLEEGYAQIKTAISYAPGRTKSYIELLVEKKVAPADIPQALPERVQPYLIYADYLIGKADPALAEAAFTKALDCIKNEAKVKAEWFYPVSRFYEKAGRLDSALGVMLNAMEYLPENTGLHLAAASLYEKLKITYRAQEEYNRVLFLDPNNKTAKRRLEKLSPPTNTPR